MWKEPEDVRFFSLKNILSKLYMTKQVNGERIKEQCL